MQGSTLLLPKKQLVGTFTQDAEYAAFIGGGRAVAFQFFAENWQGGMGSGLMNFTIEMASAPKEDQFLDSSVSVSLLESPSLSTLVVVSNIRDFSSFVRVKAVPTLAGATSVDVWVRMNILGSGT